jgi:type I restriction enzyme, S subunit
MSNSMFPAGWNQVVLGSLVDVLDSRRIPVSADVRNKRPGSVPYYGANGQQGFIDGAIFDEPLILLAEDGGNFDEFASRAIAYRISGPSWVNNHAHVIRAVENVHQDFIFFALEHRDIRKYISGGTRTKLTQGELRSIEISVPSLTEQQGAAEVLNIIDEAIRSTERLVAKLEQAKQGMFHDLLTWGINESGQLRDPSSHPNMFLETPMGLFPRAWKVGLLGEVVSRGEYGISLPLAYGSGIPIIRMNNLHGGEIVLQDIKSCPLPIPSQLFLKPGDVLFNRTNSMDHVGRTGIWRGRDGQFSFASYLIRLVHDPKTILPQYLNMLLNYSETQLNLRKYATPGVHQVNVNPSNLRRVPIAYPPSTTEQAAICERVEAVNAEIAQLRRELRQRRLIKRGLMDDLLTGRVRVSASA